MHPPLYREDIHGLLIRAGMCIPTAVTGWLATHTVLPRWVAGEVASWLAVAVVLAALVVENRAYKWLKREYGNMTTDTEHPGGDD